MPASYVVTGNVNDPAGLAEVPLVLEYRAALKRVEDVRAKRLPRNSAAFYDAHLGVRIFSDELRRRGISSRDCM